MKFIPLLAIWALSIVLISGCTVQSRTLADLKDVPADGETGQITYPDNPKPVVGINKGDYAPDFTIITTKGDKINLRELSNSKQPVMLYFFATWCPYCKDDLDNAEKIYPDYADKVMFIAIDMDLSENVNVVDAYQKEHSYQLVEFAAGREQILRDYSVTHTSTKYAIAKSGIILWKGSGVADEKTWKTLFTGLAY